MKKVFLEISQNSQENTCPIVSLFNKAAGLSFFSIKKRLWHKCFPVNFAKFLGAPFLYNTFGSLLLKTQWFIHNLITYKTNLFSFAGICKFQIIDAVFNSFLLLTQLGHIFCSPCDKINTIPKTDITTARALWFCLTWGLLTWRFWKEIKQENPFFQKLGWTMNWAISWFLRNATVCKKDYFVMIWVVKWLSIDLLAILCLRKHMGNFRGSQTSISINSCSS